MYDLAAALERITLMQKAALPATKAAFAQFWRLAPNFPYWTNRLGPLRVAYDGEPDQTHTWQVVMRLVIGHLTQDYEGALEGRLPGWLQDTVAYFQARPQLRRDYTDAELLYLSPLGASVVGVTGYRAFVRIGESSQIGAEITLEVPFQVTIEKAV